MFLFRPYGALFLSYAGSYNHLAPTGLQILVRLHRPLVQSHFFEHKKTRRPVFFIAVSPPMFNGGIYPLKLLLRKRCARAYNYKRTTVFVLQISLQKTFWITSII